MSFEVTPQPNEPSRKFLARWYDEAEQRWSAAKATGDRDALKTVSAEILDSLRKASKASDRSITSIPLQGERYPASSTLHVFPDLQSVDETLRGRPGEAYRMVDFLSDKRTLEILRWEHKQMWHRRYELDMWLENIEPLLKKRPKRRKSAPTDGEAPAEFRTPQEPGLSEPLADAPARSPQDEAQELVYAAWEAADPAEALSFARQALAKDPDCVDAQVIVATQTALSDDDLLAALEKAVATGERVLGSKYFKENRGHFWGLLETRPYMRARSQMADLLCRMGRESEAVAHFEAMLGLNPSDNLGVRYPLLGLYLAKDDLAGTRRLLRKYEESSSAVFHWGRTLERFLSVDLLGAERALREAQIQNRFVEPYLTGRKKIPPALPASYILGSEDEALVCLEAVGQAWAKHPEALAWLRAFTLRRKAS